MREIQYIITDEQGIHARPAGRIGKIARGFTSKIMISNGVKEVDLKQIIGVMGLGVKKGESIRITFEGVDEAAAAEAVEAFLKANM